MADRRMFAKTIIDSDAFLDMPQSTQNLYFHLCMRADDDGFINNPQKVQRTVNGSDDDAKLLCAKNFIIPFESGIIVIKHWRIHNYLRADRYKETVYVDEKSQLTIKKNGAYTLVDGNDLPVKKIKAPLTPAQKKRYEAKQESDLPYSFEYKMRKAFIGMECPICKVVMENYEYMDKKMPSIQHNIPISKGGKHELGNISIICEECNYKTQDTETGPLNNKDVIRVWEQIGNGSGMETQVRLGKVRLGKDNIERPDANASSKNHFHKPTIEEVKAYCTDRGNQVDANKWMAHYDSVGWKVGKNSMKDWKAAVRTWEPDGFKSSVLKRCKSCGCQLAPNGNYVGRCINEECSEYKKEIV